MQWGPTREQAYPVLRNQGPFRNSIHLETDLSLTWPNPKTILSARQNIYILYSKSFVVIIYLLNAELYEDVPCEHSNWTSLPAQRPCTLDTPCPRPDIPSNATPAAQGLWEGFA